MRETCLIVGAGQAGLTAAQTLRERGYAGAIALVGDEPEPPYQRPPLSKAFLAGSMSAERLALKPPAFFTQADVTLHPNLAVTALDLAAGRAHHAGGALPFDRLVLATGTRARRVGAPGAELPGVFTLRTIGDVDRIRPALRPGAKVVIVGGGYIGLEVAAVAVKSGADVTVLEAAERVLQRVVAAPVSAFFEELHRAAGVKLMTGTGLAGIAAAGEGLAVATSTGADLPADLVLVAVGAVPNTELAAAAGLAVEDGIVVDAGARASREGVFAAGDCTRFPSALYGRALRLESVQNAIDQAKQVAASLTGGPAGYDPLPWFWSDQYDIKLQIAGLSHGHDQWVARGDMAARAFSVFYLSGGRLLAVDSVNRPRDHMLARRAIGKRLAPGAAPEAIATTEAWEALFS